MISQLFDELFCISFSIFWGRRVGRSPLNLDSKWTESVYIVLNVGDVIVKHAVCVAANPVRGIWNDCTALLQWIEHVLHAASDQLEIDPERFQNWTKIDPKRTTNLPKWNPIDHKVIYCDQVVAVN